MQAEAIDAFPGVRLEQKIHPFVKFHRHRALALDGREPHLSCHRTSAAVRAAEPEQARSGSIRAARRDTEVNQGLTHSKVSRETARSWTNLERLDSIDILLNDQPVLPPRRSNSCPDSLLSVTIHRTVAFAGRAICTFQSIHERGVRRGSRHVLGSYFEQRSRPNSARIGGPDESCESSPPQGDLDSHL